MATENTPTDLTSVTPLQYEEGYLVADGGAADIIRDGLFSQLGYLASQGMTKIYKLMRADGGFVAQYCATAEAGGPHKIVMAGGKAFPIDTSDALRMGYGQATDPAIPPELLVLPQSQTGGSDTLMHYLPGVGWQFIDLPMAGQVWRGVDICPNNGSEWLIWTNKTLYWTATAGRMWVQIFTPPEDEGVMRYHTIQGVGFTGKGSEWIFAMASSDGFNNQGSALVVGVRGQRLRARIAGTCDFPRWMRTTTAPYQYVGPMRRGYDGEIWALVAPIGHSANGVSYDRQAWIDTTGVTIHEISDTSYAPACLRDPAAGRAGIAVWGTNVGITPNYQTTVPVPTVSAGTSVVSCSLGLIVGGRTGIGMIVNLDSDPTVQVIAAGGTVVGQMVAGSLRRGAGVLCDHTNLDGTRTIYAHNGVQWAATTTPDIVTAICPVMGVVER